LLLGPLKLRNRVIKAATFESMCDRLGVPTDELVRFHTRQITGGVGTAKKQLTLVGMINKTYSMLIFSRLLSLLLADTVIDHVTAKCASRQTDVDRNRHDDSRVWERVGGRAVLSHTDLLPRIGHRQ
jgi:hypothetical protein